jgi:endoglucanase
MWNSLMIGKKIAMLAAFNLIALLFYCKFPTMAFAKDELPFFRGVNLASGSFGAQKSPRRYGYEYIYSGSASVDYFHSKGFNLFRVAFLWENMQPVLQGSLSPTELGHLDALVNYATGKGLFVALDVHNYARHDGRKLGIDLPVEVLADLWSRLASHYKDNPRVLFDLMNEPNNMPTQTVKNMAQAAIDAIRATGAENTIMVEGNAWSGAWHWHSSDSGMLAELVDPVGNIVFSPHQYLDSNGSGTQPSCLRNTIGVERIRAVTLWARENKVRLLLGEFGAGANATCQAAVTSMLDYMQQHPDVWIGWAWWAGGPWWGDYFSSIEPQNGMDRPQMQWLTPYLDPQ